MATLVPGVFHDTADLTLEKESPVPLGTGEWVGYTTGPDVWGRQDILPLSGIEARFLRLSSSQQNCY
jgi:hypothetical protein